ncbi:MAG: hypothetical protein KDK36_13640, partial [Leptospiraceae bacterium]|nr:hypothetical protein [Leptospiraceae bacterium]
FNDLDFDLEFAKEINTYSLNIAKEFIPGEIFGKLKSDYKIFTYTVNQKEDMLRMLQNNVDGIFTNYPQELSLLKQSM